MNGKKLNGILIEEQNVDTHKDRILRLCIDLYNKSHVDFHSFSLTKRFPITPGAI